MYVAADALNFILDRSDVHMFHRSYLVKITEMYIYQKNHDKIMSGQKCYLPLYSK